MTATLTLDDSGRLLLPDAILRVLSVRPGTELKAEVSPGRIELVSGDDDVPVITEISADGTLVYPPGVKAPTAEKIVAAIKADREERIAKLSGR